VTSELKAAKMHPGVKSTALAAGESMTTLVQSTDCPEQLKMWL